jgi:hypothetical protein
MPGEMVLALGERLVVMVERGLGKPAPMALTKA